ncbi:ATP-binding protein [Kitasatospora sp. NPDC056783]|uniref:ATP-binding protein n=1 Tax=Kitasatospora sp. NPDC056783 TaxID=3345943 RepID=UPI003691A248
MEDAANTRRSLLGGIRRWGLPMLSDPRIGDIELLAAELINNAVIHTGKPVQVTASWTGTVIRLEVTDSSTEEPVTRDQFGEELTNGQGMVLVNALSDSWGVEVDHESRTKVVWFECALEPTPSIESSHLGQGTHPPCPPRVHAKPSQDLPLSIRPPLTEDRTMSAGTRATPLLKTTTATRRPDIAASFDALTQACEATGNGTWRAQLVSDSPNHLWSLSLRSRPRALAIVHPNADEALALIKGAQLLREHQVAATAPYFTDIRAAADGQAVSFWHQCGSPTTDTSLSAWVTALTHRIDPATAPWLQEHDPFAGLLDGMDHAPLDEPARRFLRERAAQLREEWDYLDWPTPDAVVLGALGMVPVHDDGLHVGLLLRRPPQRGHLEWDLVAARWRGEMLTGPREDHRTYAATYLSYEREHQAPGHPYIGAWSGYQVVRDLVVLATVMDTVRRARLDQRARRLAAHQIACLRGAHPAPWDWGPR